MFLVQERPTVNINRNFQFLNRLQYFYGGHVSNDVIILTIAKPHMWWEWNLNHVQDISSYPIHTEIFASKINEINFIPGRTVFVTSEKYRPTNHRPLTALCH